MVKAGKWKEVQNELNLWSIEFLKFQPVNAEKTEAEQAEIESSLKASQRASDVRADTSEQNIYETENKIECRSKTSLKLCILIFIIWFLICIVVFLATQNWGFVDAAYFCVTSLATIGMQQQQTHLL